MIITPNLTQGYHFSAVRTGAGRLIFVRRKGGRLSAAFFKLVLGPVPEFYKGQVTNLRFICVIFCQGCSGG
jgi:hypothetical protein